MEEREDSIDWRCPKCGATNTPDLVNTRKFSTYQGYYEEDTNEYVIEISDDEFSDEDELICPGCNYKFAFTINYGEGEAIIYDYRRIDERNS